MSGPPNDPSFSAMTYGPLPSDARDAPALLILSGVMNDARASLRTISKMSALTMYLGLALFGMASVVSVVLRIDAFVLAFGGLAIGAALSFFLLRPPKEIKRTLAEMIQAEIIFLTFYEELHFWVIYGSTNIDMAKRREILGEITKASERAVLSLNKWVKKPNPNSESSGESSLTETVKDAMKKKQR